MKHIIYTLLSLMLLPLPAMAEDAAHMLTGREVAQAVGQQLIKQGAGDELRVRIGNVRESDVLATAAAPIRVDASDVEADIFRGQWNGVIQLSSGGKNLAPIRVSGRFEVMEQVPVLKRRMQSGEIISEEDIAWEAVPSAHLRKSTAHDLPALVGKSPRRSISAGRPIRLDEIAGPTVIEKGKQVTLVFSTPRLSIKTLGEAMENGAKGDVVKVKNVASNALVTGTVMDSGMVRISMPGTESAEVTQ